MSLRTIITKNLEYKNKEYKHTKKDFSNIGRIGGCFKDLLVVRADSNSLIHIAT